MPRTRIASSPENDETANDFQIPNDTLSLVTDELRLRNLFHGVVRVSPPWGYTVTLPGVHGFLVTSGVVYLTWLEGASLAPVAVRPGDMLLLPHGLQYRVQDGLGTPPSMQTSPKQVQDGGRGRGPEDTEFIGMAFQFDSAHRTVLTNFLPQVIHLRKSTPGLTRWLKPAIDLFEAENGSRAPGRAAILRRVAEIVCVQVIRIWLEQLPLEARGWLRGLKDDQIALALQAIHSRPEARWTVELLAKEAGMSRTVFATRFKALVGEPPMSYMAHWRMFRAASLLERQSIPLKSVVQASGYRSSSTFRANFKRKVRDHSQPV